jgi:signal transduction histidine kinase
VERFAEPFIVMTAVAVGCAAVAALAWVRYRGSRDPHMLFLAAGFGVIAVQAAIFGIFWPYRHPAAAFFGYLPTQNGSRSTALTSVHGWQAGWVIAAACFVLGLPWWDRRGRAPIRSGAVLLAAGLVTAGADAVLLTGAAAKLNQPSQGPFVVPGGGPGIDAAGWVLGLVAIALLGVATVRELRAARPHSASQWIGVSFAFALGIQLAILLHATRQPGSSRPAGAMSILIPALAFAGLLVAQHIEGSHMRRASDRAAQVLGGRAEIASMVAHEARGPISTIRGLAGTAVTNYDRLSDDERREFLGLIELESRRLLGTLDQISLGLNVDAVTVRLAVRDDDIAAAVREGVEAADTAGHEVAVDAEPDLTAKIDRKWIAQVVRQLVDNAAKFSPPGSPIRVSVRRDGSDVTIDVIDAGPGIPPEMRELVFTKFPNWRPDGYQEKPGSGLGLFIAKGLVAEHSGEIVVEDAAGGGTMLRVRLPVER